MAGSLAVRLNDPQKLSRITPDVRDASIVAVQTSELSALRRSNLQRLTLSYCAVDCDLSDILPPSLKSLTLDHCSRVGDAILSQLAHVEEVSLSGVWGISPASVQALTSSPIRRALRLSNVEHVSDSCFDIVGDSLTRLEVTGLTTLTCRSLALLAKAESLQHIVVELADPSEGLDEMLAAPPSSSVTSIVLESSAVLRAKVAEAIAALFPARARLGLAGGGRCEIQALNQLLAADKLREVSIRGMEVMNRADGTVSWPSSLTSFECIGAPWLLGTDLRDIAQSGKLKSLRVSECLWLVDADFDDGLFALMPLLELLDISHSRLSLKMLSGLHNCRTLKSLRLVGLRKPEQGVSPGIPSLQLESLDLSENWLSEDVLAFILSIGSLKSLRLRYCMLSKGTIRNVLQVLRLRSLDLDFARKVRGEFVGVDVSGLVELRLAASDVDLEDLRSIARLQSLERLDLSALRLSDDVLEVLSHNHSLAELRLSGSDGISEEAVARLADACPQLLVWK